MQTYDYTEEDINHIFNYVILPKMHKEYVDYERWDLEQKNFDQAIIDNRIERIEKLIPYTHARKHLKDKTDKELCDFVKQSSLPIEALQILRELDTSYLGTLSQFDIILVEKYAPKLFNKYTKLVETVEIEDNIYSLLNLLAQYRGKENQAHFDNHSAYQLYNNSKDKDRFDKLQKKVQSLYKAIIPEQKEVKAMLQKIHDNPQIYFKPKINLKKKISTTDIEQYLLSLPLNKKKSLIKTFIKELKKIS